MSDDEQADDLSGDQPVSAIPQVGPSRSETLESDGFETVRDVRRADVSDVEALFNLGIARQIKDNAGDVPRNPPSIAQAKQKAQGRPGAKAKTIKVDGQQRAKVLEMVEDQNVGGAHVQIRKG